MIGLVVMAYGTPASLDEVGEYYTHIRHGRPPAPIHVEELQDRYRAIGGVSPLRAITDAQARRLAAALGDGWRVAVGYKHAPPFIEDAVAQLHAGDVEGIAGVVLAPHRSRGSVDEYVGRLEHAAAGHGLAATAVQSWYDLPEYLDFVAAAVVEARQALPDRTTVLFTAHSLPERVLAGDDPYPAQLEESAAAVAARAGLDRWQVCWQSAGRTDEPWRGPDVRDVMIDLYEAEDTDGVLVCPIGFVADHLEVLYDIDVVVAEWAAELKFAFARTRSLNDDPTVLAALAERVRAIT